MESKLYQKVPVLFIILNRKGRALESFRSIKRYQPSRLYIAADGPRKNKIGEDVQCRDTRDAILAEIDWDCEIHTLFRNENVGCGRGVSEAITWMFRTEEYGIINEDDCVVSDSFFLFCEQLLPLYCKDDRIAQINGFDSKYSGNTSNTYYFTSYPEIWGWATWRRAWENIDFEMSAYPQIRKNIWKRFPFVEALIHYLLWNRLYRHIKQGKKIYAWGFQWSIYVFMHHKLCVNPFANLVVNTGFGEGTNCNNPDTPFAQVQYGKLEFPLQHPQEIRYDSDREKLRSQEYVGVYRMAAIARIKRVLRKMIL